MRRRSALENAVPECQGLQTASSRALAIPEILELVLEDIHSICTDLQLRRVNRLWNATYQSKVLRSVTILEDDALGDYYPYSDQKAIAMILLYNEPELARCVRSLNIRLLSESLDNAARPSQRGDGWRVLVRTLPHMTRLQELMLDSTTARWLPALAPIMEGLRTLYINFGPEEYTDAMDTNILDSLAQCRNLRTLCVAYEDGHFDRAGRLRPCSDYFRIAGKQITSLSLWLFGLGAELLRKVLTAIGSQCPVLGDLTLHLTECESRKLDSFRPLLTDTLQHLKLSAGKISSLTEFLEALVNPSFLPNLTTAPVLTEISCVTRNIPLALFDKALQALEQRGTITNLASMRAELHRYYGKQIEGQ